MTTTAAYQRRYRTTRALRLQVALALVDVGRLGAWDEQNLPAIDEAILRLALDWAASVSRSNGVCPIKCAHIARSESQDPHDVDEN
jgi:hypothetical protein